MTEGETEANGGKATYLWWQREKMTELGLQQLV